MENKPIINSWEFAVMEYNDTLNLAFYESDYEFVKVDCNNNIIYKKHPIKSPEDYKKIKRQLQKLISKYEKLLTNADEIGIDIEWIIKNLNTIWIRPKNLAIKKFVDIYNKTIKNSSVMYLPYKSNSNFSKCIFNKIYFKENGEIYLEVTYKNNGFSVFGTYNLRTETYNLRDIDNIEWFNSINNICDMVNKYLEDISYSE